MLIPTSGLGRFDSLVIPYELEAYDNLKNRTSKQLICLWFIFTPSES